MTAPGAPATPARRARPTPAPGVDIEAGDRAVELMKAAVERGPAGPEVSAASAASPGCSTPAGSPRYRRPLLATSTDGVGTKVAIAQRIGRHDTIGIDLVGMVVDDLVVCGAEPLFMTDYIATGRVVPERIAAIVAGIAEGCVRAGCALVGGETAEHPGLLGPDEYDVAGAATGVVEADRLLGPDRVRPGDVVIAMASSGLHSNGYSLVRHVLDRAGLALDAEPPELGRTLGEELLEPDPHLRPGLPRPGGRMRRARVRARHRRRAGGQPGPGAAARRRRGARPGHLDAAAGLRPAGRARRGRRGRAGADVQHGRRAWSRWSRPDDADRALRRAGRPGRAGLGARARSPGTGGRRRAWPGACIRG